MALSPDDIVNYEFKQSLRGYAVTQVDELLDRLADQVERSQREADELRQRLRDTEARLAAALETESTLKRTLITAQQAAERSLEDARQQADELRTAAEREVTERLERSRTEAQELVTQAQAAADARMAGAREERDAIEQRIEQLREIERHHRRALKQHLKAQLDALKALDELSARTGLTALDAEAEASGEPVGGPSLKIRVRDVEGSESEHAQHVERSESEHAEHVERSESEHAQHVERSESEHAQHVERSESEHAQHVERSESEHAQPFERSESEHAHEFEPGESDDEASEDEDPQRSDTMREGFEHGDHDHDPDGAAADTQHPSSAWPRPTAHHHAGGSDPFDNSPSGLPPPRGVPGDYR